MILKLYLTWVFLALCQCQMPPQQLPHLYKSMILSTRKYTASCMNTKGGIICKSCDTAMLCDLTGNILREAKCSELTSPKTPFCDDARRVCVADNVCTSSTTMACRYQGFFPHPMDCQMFVYCSGKDQKPQEYNCPKKTRYNHALQTCTLDASCHNFPNICENKPNRWVTYPGDDSIFVYCFTQGSLSEMYTCNSSDERMTSWGTCEFGCKTEGIFHVTDPSKFLMCYRDGFTMAREEMYCKAGTLFNPTSHFCEETTGNYTNTAQASSETAEITYETTDDIETTTPTMYRRKIPAARLTKSKLTTSR